MKEIPILIIQKQMSLFMLKKKYFLYYYLFKLSI